MSYNLYLFLFITVNSILIVYNFSQVVYTTVYGKVSSGTPQVTGTTVSYEECAKLCIARSMCVLSYGSTSCQLYDYGSVESVTQLAGATAESEDIVSFRINRDSTECPAKPAVNPPTFDNYPATGLIVSNGSSHFYRITLNSGVWTFEYLQQNTNLTCNVGWKPVARKFGIVCLRRIWRSTTSNCADYRTGAIYSGMESDAELEIFKAEIIADEVMFLNAEMTTDCQTSKNCDDVMLGPYLTLPARLSWLSAYPVPNGNCVAASNYYKQTIGLINLKCSEQKTNWTMYCVYSP